MPHQWSKILLIASAICLASSQISPVPPTPKTTNSFCVWGNQPVCGDDYTTYPSLCALQDAGINLVHYGNCVQVMNANGELETECPKELNEVCGVDGITYGNQCRLDARKIAFAYQGPCVSSTKAASNPFVPPVTPIVCDCPLDFKPVCTMLGITYESNCVLLCKQQIALTMEPCATQCVCPKTYEPVCAGDGKTYDNACTLDCVRAVLVGYGECSNIVNTCDNCSSVYLPVYSKDGTNYDNFCKLYCNKGEFGGFGRATNTAAAKAEAIRKKCAQCSKLYLPICGNDGKTYDNECLCTCTEACEKYSNGKCPNTDPSADVNMKYSECQSFGTKEVCGVDNKTYENKCFLEKAKIELQYPGPCKLRGEYNNKLPVNPQGIKNTERRQAHIVVINSKERSRKQRSKKEVKAPNFKDLSQALDWFKMLVNKRD